MTVCTRELEFWLEERVFILPLQINGVVIGIKWDASDPMYQVRFWYEGSIRKEWAFAEELSDDQSKVSA